MCNLIQTWSSSFHINIVDGLLKKVTISNCRNFVKLCNLYRFDFCSGSDILTIGGISLTFQIIKGIWLLIASLNAIKQAKKYEKAQEKLQNCENPKLTVLKTRKQSSCPNQGIVAMAVPTISIQCEDVDTQITEDESKNCWDPLEPAYDAEGNLKSKLKKVTWAL